MARSMILHRYIHPSEKKKFAGCVKAWRKKNGLCIDDAARTLKTKVHTMERWEQGKQMPEGEMLERIIKRGVIRIKWCLHLQEVPPKPTGPWNFERRKVPVQEEKPLNDKTQQE